MKSIPNYENYLISSDGLKVINTTTNHELKQGEQVIRGKVTGYLYVTLYNVLTGNKRISVHRLVALTYLDNPEGKPWVNHKDGNKRNNNVSNLEWTTIKENIVHSIETGLRTYKKGIEHHLTGRKSTDKCKKLQSLAKIGDKHPKFKGYYIINGSKFSSINEAARVLKLHPLTIKKRTADPRHKDFSFLPKR